MLLCAAAFACRADSDPPCNPDRFDRPATIEYVIDGDTVVLASGDHVRLIGLDTPEIAHGDGVTEPGAMAARDALRALLPVGTHAALAFDSERRDRHGRTLAHVFLTHGLNVQAWLLEQGYGTPFAVPPNLRFETCYAAAANRAISASRGVWSLPAYRVRGVESLAPEEHGYRRVRGRVNAIGTSTRSLWLEMGPGFAVRIARADLPWFVNMDPATLAGTTIEVRGMVYRRNGQLRMHIRHEADLLPAPGTGDDPAQEEAKP